MMTRLQSLRGASLERAASINVQNGRIPWLDAAHQIPAGHNDVVFVTWDSRTTEWPSSAVLVVTLAEAELHQFDRAYAVWAETTQQANFAVRRQHALVIGAKPDSDSALHFAIAPAHEPTLTVQNPSKSSERGSHEPIAIIGVGAVMPGALNAPEFWENIKGGVSSISDVPPERWNTEFFFSDDREAPDKTYSKIGGWITGYEFDRKQFRMPPSVIDKIDHTQLVCLTSVREALNDAGYLERDFDRDRCAVILGNSLGGDLRDQTTLRVHYAEIESQIKASLIAGGKLSAAEIDVALTAAEFAVKSTLGEVNEDSMPGELANVIAGRVASAFDLRGPNFVVDAACASSLAAIETSVRGLRSGQFDMAVTGGSDRTMGPASFVKFSKIGALSPDGSRPFDADANGFVMGEGAGILILKRLDDAQRDGDRVYAVIRGVGGSSDGKGKGITAPNPKGQVRAMQRAWDDAGLSPRSATLIEAHGTSTPVGDPTEVASLHTVLNESPGDYAGDVRLGSVKSMIGHLKSASGAAGMIKVAFALRDAVLPPTINVTRPNPDLALDGSRIRIQTQTEPWLMQDNHPRRAGVSAFGFGGTNFHIVMEEYLPNKNRSTTTTPFPEATPMIESSPIISAGVLALSASSPQELVVAATRLADDVKQRGIDSASPHMLRASRRAPLGQYRIAIAFSDVNDLSDKLVKATSALQTQRGWKVLANQGILYSERRMGGLLAMLSPGQGSQYLGMGAELARLFPVVRQTLNEADAVMQPILGKRLSDLIAPDLSTKSEHDAFVELSQTEVTQPAVLAIDVAIARLLETFGVRPDMVAGHSLGEYGACVAAGVMSFEDALLTVAARGTEMAKATPMNGDCGIMAGIPAPLEVVEKVLAETDGYVVCANKNCPGQTIIAGLTDPTLAAMKRFEELGYQVVQLLVSHAFHSKVVAAASAPLRNHLATVKIDVPRLPILTNVTGDLYPSQPGSEEAIRDLLAQQVAAPVEFIEMIETMYELGTRTFVEVGPKRAQQAFVQAILGDREHVAMFTNHPKKGEIASFHEALAQLWVSGAMDHSDVHVDVETPLAAMSSNRPRASREDVVERMVAILCDKTGYDSDEIEPEFELEADLGIDTVKQAEIMASVREIYGFERDDLFKLAEYPSVNHLADYVIDRMGKQEAPAVATSPAPIVAAPAVVAVPPPVVAVPTPIMVADPVAPNVVSAAPVVPTTAPSASRANILAKMTEILCEKTGYDPDEIEPEFELEADLGIDTVKQAEIMASVRDVFGFERDDQFKLAEYPSLNHLTEYVVGKMGASPAPAPTLAATANIVVEAPAKLVVADAVIPVVQVAAAAPVAAVARPQAAPAAQSRDQIIVTMIEILCDKTGYDPDEIEAEFELEADLGIDTVKQAEIMASVREIYAFERDDQFKLAEYPTLARLADYVLERLAVGQGVAPAPGPVSQAQPKAILEHAPAVSAPKAAPSVPVAATPPSAPTHATMAAEFAPTAHRPVAITGCALGLPGNSPIFSDDTVDRLLAGENFIEAVPQEQRDAMVKKRIVRLVKLKNGGGGDMEEVTSSDDVIKLAGRPGAFDLTEWGLSDRMIDSLDDTSQLAIAAGLSALRDAGLPLLPRYRLTTTGKRVTVGWSLPESLAVETGVIFASAFAGQDALVEEVTASTKPDYQFNHRLLLRMLGIANSRFAEIVGARGPNTKINSACASTTTAIGMAQDWITLGRCKRVVILGADNASGASLFEWIGSGFLATGAASTEARVEDAALPFDKRRDGMVIGMGAVALIVEAPGLAEARGIEPIAEVLGTRFVNSALHPTRLDVDHIASEVDALLSDVESKFGVKRAEAAAKTVFVSHETYTPARGGSADAEIASLRRAFGENADDVVIANTKGFTGHAMAAGIEDVLAIKALQHRRLPPIANFKEPDPNLGNLRLSQGGKYELDYALRLAAGFGSQLAIAFLRFRARTENRVVDPERYATWIEEISGFEHPETFIEHRMLKLRDNQPKDRAPKTVEKKEVVETSLPKTQGATLIRPQSVVAQAKTAARVDNDRLREELDGKRVVVLAGPMLINDLVVRSLEGFGAQVEVFNNGRTPLGDGVAVDFGDETHLQASMKGIGRIDGIVNLTGFGADSFSGADVERATLHTFNAARAWYATQGEPSADMFFLSVTGMGGRLGFDRATGPLPLSGAVAGITKSLAREWTHARIKVVDVAREGFYPELGRQVLDALFDDTNGVEVGVIGGVQWGPTYIDPSEIFAHGLSLLPIPGEVVLVTGGARGITSAILQNLARRAPATYILIGRTAFNGPAVLDLDLDAEKSRIRDELKASGERVTPVAIQKRLNRILAQQEIAQTLANLGQTGSKVEYVSCDLADAVSVRQMVTRVVAAHGPIAGFIHGAGVEESKLIHEKDRAGFDRVFAGKALGALALWESARSESLKFAVLFSSVAGRFGNIGQADYSAANECLNKLAQLINASSRTRALSIDWTAWDDVGMATEGSMKQILESRGIDLLPASQGAPMVADLLDAGIYGEVLVAGRLGDMFDGPVPHKAELSAVSQTTEKATFERTLSLDDPFMRDHVYEGHALLPGVMGLEFMHEAARVLGHDSWVASDVRFDKAVKLLRDEPITIKVTAERRENGIRAWVETNRKSVTGRQLDDIHFEATFSRTPDRVPPHWVLDVSQAVVGPDHDEIYTRFFHTGAFRVLDKVALLTKDYVVAHGHVPATPLMDGKDAGQVSTQPLLTEMMFQAIGIWGMVHKNVTSLPNRISSWELFRTIQAGSPVCIRALKIDVTDTHLVFDAEVRDEFGHLVAFAQGIELIIHQTLPTELAFGEFELSRGDTIQMNDPEARAWVADHGLKVEEMLGSQELESWTRFLSERRKSEWFAARIAAKRGIAAWIRDVRGLAAHPRDILIDKDESKAPYPTLRGALAHYKGPLPHLSITHSGGVAVVHVGTRTDMRIGVDLEAVEARDSSFANEYFTEAELKLGASLGRDQQLTVLWTIKESVSKALGLGLHVRLAEIVIETLDLSQEPWVAGVRLDNEASEALTGLHGNSMDVRLFNLDTFILAEATFVASAEVVMQEDTVLPAPEGAHMFAAVAALLHHKGLLKTTPRGEALGANHVPR